MEAFLLLVGPVAIVVMVESPGFQPMMSLPAKATTMKRWLASSHVRPFGPMSESSANAVDTSPERVSLKMRSGPGCVIPDASMILTPAGTASGTPANAE